MNIKIIIDNESTLTTLVNGQPDLTAYTGISFTIRQEAFIKGNYVVVEEVESNELVPDPMGFRNKLYGINDSSLTNTLFHQVYIPTTIIATNPNTSNAALTEARNILEGSLWNEPFSKSAFSNSFESGSFDILKAFLSPNQIEEVQKAAIEFNLL